MTATQTSARQNLAPTQDQRATSVVGLQWGDEGKGKIVDLLAADHDAVVRYNGGANAGHSLEVDGQRYSLHLIPSGILYPGKAAVIGNGVVVDPEGLVNEIEGLRQRGIDTAGLVVSSRAHVVMPYHKAEDRLRERILSGEAGGSGKRDLGIGTTLRGIGPCYAEKCMRAAAVRISDLLSKSTLRSKLDIACTYKNALFEAAGSDERFDADTITRQMLDAGARIEPLVRDTTYYLHDMVAAGQRLLFEGGNATLLDVDHGTYPYVTSSSCSALGIGPGTGLPPQRIGRILGVMKAYTTRVGKGPLPTELTDHVGDAIRERGREYGTTTGRPRRVGWLDLVATKYAAMINGATGLSVMMMDVLAGLNAVKVCTAYEIDGDRTERFPADSEALTRARPVYETPDAFPADLTSVRSMSELPGAARAYLDLIEEFVGVPIEVVSVGPDRTQTIRP